MLPLADLAPDQLPSFFQNLVLNPKSLEVLTDLQAMKLALIEASKGVGFVSPNPLVGCVILDHRNRFLSRGFHSRVGEPHAEVEALRGLSQEQLKGAKIFVTLEPCAHEGRTPSCAKAIAKLPISELIYGIQDPNPLVAGQGAEILKSAGINVHLSSEYFSDRIGQIENDVLQTELESICEHFLTNYQKQKPFVSIKIASSLDGYLGLKSGESQWITSQATRDFAQILRASHDATLVGKNTVLKDDPKLDLRHPRFQSKKNKVVVLDSKGEILKSKKAVQLFERHSPENLIWVVEEGFIASEPRAQVLPVKRTTHLNEVLTGLWQLGVKSLFVEGGGQVLSSFINEKSFDRLYLFQGPLLLGGQSGQSWSEGVKVASISSGIRLKNQRVIQLNEDLLISGTKAE